MSGYFGRSTGWKTLKQANVDQTTVSGTTNKTTSFSVTVPGGTLGVNGRLRVTAKLSFTGTNGTKGWGTDFGGTTFYSVSGINASNITDVYIVTIENRNSASAQIGHATSGQAGGNAQSTVALATGTIDTTADQTLTVWIQLASALDSGVASSVLVEYNNDAP